MKVLLLNPPSLNELIANDPLVCKSEGGVYPPLGILYVAAYLERYSNHKVEVIDSIAEGVDYQNLGLKVKEKQPDIVGITAMTFTIIDVMKSVKAIKKELPGVKIVLGGPHVHLFPEETIGLEGIDYLVLGEGEETFKELLDAIEGKILLEDVRGIAFKKGGDVVITGERGFVQDLDLLPFPARHLTRIDRYYSLIAKRTPITTMFTSRGCPYKCSFCDRPHLGKSFRARSAKNVVDEMEQSVNLGLREFFIYDDTFTVDRKRAVDICNEIIARGLRIAWDIRSRVDTVDSGMLRLFKKAGCERIHFGVESGNAQVLKTLQKGITLEKAKESFLQARNAGLETLAYFMIGCPGETKEDMMETLRFAKIIKPDYAHFTILTPFPGTEIYRKGLSSGLYQEDYWRLFAKNPALDFMPKYWEEHFTRKELEGLLARMYKGFYSRPDYIMKGLSRVRSLGELKRKVRAGLKVLAM